MDQSPQQDVSRNQGQSATAGNAYRLQPCCVQATMHVNNLYQHSHAQAQYYYGVLQTIQGQLRHSQNQVDHVQRELNRERETSELVHQEYLQLKMCHELLKKDQESGEALSRDLTQTAQDSQEYAELVAKQAEELVNELGIEPAGERVTEMRNSQGISRMILESAKNQQLVAAMMREHSSDERLSQMKYVMDQNVDFQLRNSNLSDQIEDLHREVRERENGIAKLENEVANLKKAHELVSEEGKRRGSSRIKNKIRRTESEGRLSV